MDEQLANLNAAFGEAGIDVPADPTSMALGELDELVEDRRLRGKCKSALVKFQRAAEEQGWSPPEGAAEPAAEPVAEAAAPEPAEALPTEDPIPPPAVEAPLAETEPEVIAELPPMSAELQEKHDAFVAAMAAASAAVPHDLVHLEVGQLDALVEDKKLRGKCKSALVKFQRQAKEEGWAPTQPARPAPATKPATPAPELVAAAPAPAPVEVEPEPEEEEEEFVPTPMSAELQPLFDAVTEAFGAAGAAVPADPVNVDLNSLDEAVEDKKLRGKCKSALVKFRRKAEADGWQAGPAPKPKKKAKSAAAASGDGQVQAATETLEQLDVPAEPQASPTDLFLLTPAGWENLGTATREAQWGDEVVGAKTESGATARMTSVLVLDGKFDVPEDLYNTYCFLAHEGVVYKAYYISHIGDVKRGTKTASLKVDQTFTYDEFAKTYLALGKHERPTADDVRRRRFGTGYDTERRMFADRDAARLV